MAIEVIDSLLAASHSDHWGARVRAAIALSAHLQDVRVKDRLVEMLRDINTAVEIEAAESLILRGGRSGLTAVLRELGERVDDSDSADIAYLLQELQGLRNEPILQEGRAIVAEGADQMVEIGLAELEELFGHYA